MTTVNGKVLLDRWAELYILGVLVSEANPKIQGYIKELENEIDLMGKAMCEDCWGKHQLLVVGSNDISGTTI